MSTDATPTIEELAIAMLTLRVDTAPGSWLAPPDEATFFDLWREAEERPDGAEDLVMSLVNLAHYALLNLVVVSGEASGTWLARIASDSRRSD